MTVKENFVIFCNKFPIEYARDGKGQSGYVGCGVAD